MLFQQHFLLLELLIVQILDLLHERFIADMDLDVVVERARLAELFLADDTLERLLAGMDLLVIGEGAELAEDFAAVVAGKWLLAGVYFRMVGECARLAELFVADGAVERFLAGVDFEVIGQRAELAELLFADRALERFFGGDGHFLEGVDLRFCVDHDLVVDDHAATADAGQVGGRGGGRRAGLIRRYCVFVGGCRDARIDGQHMAAGRVVNVVRRVAEVLVTVVLVVGLWLKLRAWIEDTYCR